MSTPAREQSGERLGEHNGHIAEPGTQPHPAPTAPRRRMLLIVNPYAATVSDGMRNLVVHALQGRFDVEAVDTKARGHATELGRQAAREGYDVVVAFGGDGTVNEAANGLLGSETPLCALPGGSANVFAKMLGIPGELVDATEHLLSMADDWRVRRVDLGVVNDRCFTFNSGIGLDATVVERVDARPELKARFGPYFFTWQALKALVRRYLVHAPKMQVDDGRHTVQGITTIVQNGAPFTYFHERPVRVSDGARLDSGRLVGAVLHRATPLAMALTGLRTMSPRMRVVGHRNISGLPEFSTLTVRSADDRALPLQVDGDFLGEVHEARYSILPGALRVVS
ncbi:MAG TPA: diacylglycerol kinase family protein [Solirubrobacteraceae bacterium]|jgi:diacylglycerol kinase family enzyme|nr:diacylglycerol kinase family protein [Solirubrobacteraceae bacterium]